MARVPGLDARAFEMNPRIAIDLAQASRANATGQALEAGGSWLAFCAATSIVLHGLVWRVSAVAGCLLLATNLMLAMLSIAVFRRAKREARVLEAALDEAWAVAASALLRAMGGGAVGPRELADAMRVTEAEAEVMLRYELPRAQGAYR